MTENMAETILAAMALLALGLHGLVPRLSLFANLGARAKADPEKRLLQVLQVLVVLAMVVVPLCDALLPWFEFADVVFLDEAAWVGLMLGSAAIWLFWRAGRDRGPALAPCGTLRGGGVYRYLRYPVYAAMLLWALAQLLLLQNWLAGPVAALTFTLAYLLRVPLEEQQNLERHGHRYLDYMERTGGIIPRLTRSRSD
ncbi:MAG: isoprenylcysteine carboxylmethyltransferase family protein [Alcanivorax sp.]|nr:isoprenylcysteine carboxylmethyltransferase family protein [Alcanivorax sp.]